MIPTIYLAFITEVVKLVNNILEGIPVEQRKANSIIWFNTTWPLVKHMFPKETQDQITAIMQGVK